MLTAKTGSPIISREGWQTLLAEQGFHDVLVAGESHDAPPLLTRQSVVLGVSDGAIRIARAKPQSRQATPAAPKAKAPAAALPVRAQSAPGGSVSVTSIVQVMCGGSSKFHSPRQLETSCERTDAALSIPLFEMVCMHSACLPYHVTHVQELQSLVSGLVGARIPEDQPLMEAGLDSIGAVELRNAVAARFGVDLPATDHL